MLENEEEKKIGYGIHISRMREKKMRDKKSNRLVGGSQIVCSVVN